MVSCSNTKALPVIRNVRTHLAIFIFDAKHLNVLNVTDQRINFDQWMQGAHAIRLWISFQNGRIRQTQYPFGRLWMTMSYFLHRKFGHGCERLILTVVKDRSDISVFQHYCFSWSNVYLYFPNRSRSTWSNVNWLFNTLMSMPRNCVEHWTIFWTISWWLSALNTCNRLKLPYAMTIPPS